MKIDAYLFSINSKDDSKFYVRASDGETTIERVYALDCSLNKAELYAAQFVAMCHRFPKEIKITTDSYYLQGILSRESGQWKKRIDVNVELVNKIRDIYSKVNFNIAIDEQQINNIRSTIKVS